MNIKATHYKDPQRRYDELLRAVPCSECRAGKGEPCRTPSGRLRKAKYPNAYHAPRKAIAVAFVETTARLGSPFRKSQYHWVVTSKNFIAVTHVIHGYIADRQILCGMFVSEEDAFAEKRHAVASVFGAPPGRPTWRQGEMLPIFTVKGPPVYPFCPDCLLTEPFKR